MNTCAPRTGHDSAEQEKELVKFRKRFSALVLGTRRDAIKPLFACRQHLSLLWLTTPR